MEKLQGAVKINVLGGPEDDKFEKILKSDKFKMAAERVKELGGEFSEELVEFLLLEAERADKSNKRKRANSKKSPKQIEDARLRGVIQEFLFLEGEDLVFSNNYLQENIEDLKELSVQKVSALVKGLIEEGVVERLGELKELDGKVGYKLVGMEEEEEND